MPDDEGARVHSLEDVVERGTERGFGVERQAAGPERSPLARRQERHHPVGGERQGGHLLPHGVVDADASERGCRVAHSPVQEDQSVHVRDGWARAHPRAVLALGLEGEPHLQGAEGRFLLELLSKRVGVERSCLASCPRGLAGGDPLERMSAQLVRPAGPKGLVLPRAHVAPVADEPHQLVIAQQGDHAATLPRCLALELAEQVDRLAGVRAAVEDVPGLDERRTSSGPSAAPADETRRPKDGRESVRPV